MRTTEIGAWIPATGRTPGNAPPGAHDDFAVDLRRRMALGEPTSPLRLGRDRGGLEPEPVLASSRQPLRARRAFWFRGAARAKGRSARTASGMPITSRLEHAQRFDQQFLSGLVALENDDRWRCHGAVHVAPAMLPCEPYLKPHAARQVCHAAPDNVSHQWHADAVRPARRAAQSRDRRNRRTRRRGPAGALRSALPQHSGCARSRDVAA